MFKCDTKNAKFRRGDFFLKASPLSNASLVRQQRGCLDVNSSSKIDIREGKEKRTLHSGELMSRHNKVGQEAQ